MPSQLESISTTSFTFTNIFFLSITFLLLLSLPMTSVSRNISSLFQRKYITAYKELEHHFIDFCREQKGLWDDHGTQFFLLRLMHVYGQRYRKEVREIIEKWNVKRGLFGNSPAPPKEGTLDAHWTYEVVSQVCNNNHNINLQLEDIKDKWKKYKEILTSVDFYLDISPIMTFSEPFSKLIKKFERIKNVQLAHLIAALVRKHDAKRGIDRTGWRKSSSTLNFTDDDFVKVRLLLWILIIEPIETMFNQKIRYVKHRIADFFKKHGDQANLHLLRLLMWSEKFRKKAMTNPGAIAKKVNSFAERINLTLEKPVTTEEVEGTMNEYDLPKHLKDVLIKENFAVVFEPAEDWYFRNKEVLVDVEQFMEMLVEGILNDNNQEDLTVKQKVRYRLAFVFAVTMQADIVRKITTETIIVSTDGDQQSIAANESETAAAVSLGVSQNSTEKAGKNCLKKNKYFFGAGTFILLLSFPSIYNYITNYFTSLKEISNPKILPPVISETPPPSFWNFQKVLLVVSISLLLAVILYYTVFLFNKSTENILPKETHPKTNKPTVKKVSSHKKKSRTKKKPVKREQSSVAPSKVVTPTSSIGLWNKLIPKRKVLPETSSVTPTSLSSPATTTSTTLQSSSPPDPSMNSLDFHQKYRQVVPTHLKKKMKESPSKKVMSTATPTNISSVTPVNVNSTIPDRLKKKERLQSDVF